MQDLRFYDPRNPDTGFLSNFYRAPFQLEGFEWPTVEHYYQAQKFEDAAYCERIRLAATPREAKTLGQTRDVPLRADWESHRMTAMLQALVAKFTLNADLQTLLLAIDDESILVEASPQDYFWGDGADGKGENRLGYLLTTLRSHLRRFLASSTQGDIEYNNSLKTPDELAKLLFESVRRMHVSWWLPELLILETQTSVLPDDLYAYVRDVNLPDGYLQRYRVGLIFREPTFCDASEHSKQGFAAKHRYFLLSNSAKHVDALFGGTSGSPGTGLSIFPPNTLWKVLATNEAQGHAQITMLEIPPEARHAFESPALSALEQTLADSAGERFTYALRLPVLDACKSADWLERLQHPLGIADDGEFLETWFNGQHQEHKVLSKVGLHLESQPPQIEANQRVEYLREGHTNSASELSTKRTKTLGAKRVLGLLFVFLGGWLAYSSVQAAVWHMLLFAVVILGFGVLVAWKPDLMS